MVKTIFYRILAIVLAFIYVSMVIAVVAFNLWYGHEWVVWVMAIGIGLSIIVGAFTSRGWRNRMKQRGVIQPSSPAQPAPVAESATASRTLKKRLAKGDITVQEYRQIRAALEKE